MFAGADFDDALFEASLCCFCALLCAGCVVVLLLVHVDVVLVGLDVNFFHAGGSGLKRAKRLPEFQI